MSLFREYCVTLNGRGLCGLGNDYATVKQMQLSFAICIGSVHAYTFNVDTNLKLEYILVQNLDISNEKL